MQISHAKNSRFECCPCCGGNKYRTEWRNTCVSAIEDWRQFFHGGRKYIGTIIACQKCGYKYINNPVDGKLFYQSAESDSYERLHVPRDIYFSKLKKIVEPYLDDNGNRHAILDLGAGNGQWLEKCSEYVSRSATEMSPSHILSLQRMGVNVFGSLNQIEKKQFQVVSAFDFLEHVTSPENLVDEVCRLLVPGGVAIFGVPDMGKIIARLLGTKYYLYCPMHYSYFTKDSLFALLNKYFTNVDVKKSPPMTTTINGILNWVCPKLMNSTFERITLPFGYRASLIAICKKGAS